ncbi:UDP-N-acetylglucosamine--N-acetylmuramyl-(pentapeptide) pyrophosphoryl-undecaprenol N-acetylglucosamine transferase [Micrococcales bacterium 31B]|nr:UDP-N-acetylglucosamine--N-acetylmuramyl-(pentapeptide) pyrophosphoryl-undecaprenol N-acetylglucosamine transferase [Micrococcales bacterium 31B]
MTEQSSSSAPRPLRVVLAGGGTTGHVAPLLATATALRARCADSEVTVVGTTSGLETRLVPQAGFELATIERVPFPRSVNRAALAFPARFARAFRQSRDLLRSARAEVVVGFGGYVCTPVYLAARSLRIPTVVHEANAVPGLANKVGAKNPGALVASTFRGCPLPGARTVGMPMRKEISGLHRESSLAFAREKLGLDPRRLTLVVTGGSSGAQRINEALVQRAAEYVATGAQVLHITGAGKAVDPGVPGFHVVEYVDGMETAYAAADFMVCRAGSATVSEVSAVGLPALYVPLGIGNGEQALNCKPVVEAGGAMMLLNSECTADTLFDQIAPVLSDAAALAEMGRIAATFSITDADEVMADLTYQAAGPATPTASEDQA